MATEKCKTSGVISDIETFLNRFAQSGSLRYTEFSRIWRDMKFSMIFAGRQNDRECREFTEDLFKIALNYFLPPFGLQTRVGGLYLLYGLFFKQLFEPKVKIRMTLAQWKDTMLFLMDEIRPQSHWDVEFVFHKLRFSHAFHYVAMQTELYPLMRNQTLEDDEKQDSDAQLPSSVSALLLSDHIEQLSEVHEQYHRVKCALGTADDDTATPPQQLNIVRDDLVQQMTRIVTTFEEWKKARAGKGGGSSRRTDGAEATESEADSDVDNIVRSGQEQSKSPRKAVDSIGQKRAEIRARAFTAGIGLPLSTTDNTALTVTLTESSKHSDNFESKKRIKSKNPTIAASAKAATSSSQNDNVQKKNSRKPETMTVVSKQPKNKSPKKLQAKQQLDTNGKSDVAKKRRCHKPKGQSILEEDAQTTDTSAANEDGTKTSNSKKRKRSDGAAHPNITEEHVRKSPRKRKSSLTTTNPSSEGDAKRRKKSLQGSNNVQQDTSGMGGLRDQLRAALKDFSKGRRRSPVKSSSSKKKNK